MADTTNSISPGLGDNSSWAGMAAFLRGAFGIPANQQVFPGYGRTPSYSSMSLPSLSSLGQSALHSGAFARMGQHSNIPIQPPIQNGIVPGMIGQTVPGPLQVNGVQNALLTQRLPPMPYGSVPSPYAPPAAPGSLTGGTGMTMSAPSSPTVGMPTLKATGPMTADHFTTGSPNPFGAR